jgi:hypothetical protein
MSGLLGPATQIERPYSSSPSARASMGEPWAAEAVTHFDAVDRQLASRNRTICD